MMNHDEQFDQFLKSKFASQTFEQKPAYWEQASRLIAADRKAAAFRMLMYSISAVVLGTIGVVVWLLNQPTSQLPVATTELVAASNNPSASFAAQTVSNTPDVNAQYAAPSSAIQSASNASKRSADPQSQNGSESGVQPQVIHSKVTPHNQPPKRRRNLIAMEEESASVSGVSTPSAIELSSRFQTAIHTRNMVADSFSKKAFYAEYTRRSSKHGFYLEAGLNAYLVDKVNFHAGLRYEHPFNEKWLLNAGMVYSQINRNLSRQYDAIDYTFGQQKNAVVITTQALQLLEIPISVAYRIHPSHELFGGVQVGYILQSKDRVTRNGEQSSSQQEYGYLQALNRLDAQTFAGYRFNVTRSVNLGIAYHYGLTDVSNNNIFKSRIFDRNSGVRLTVGYRIR